MKIIISYKYINLLIRAVFSIGALIFITIKLYRYWATNSFELLKMNSIQFYLLFFAFLLIVLNWGIEAFKWKYLIRKLAPISLKNALQLIITGITIGLITPNRVGEIPARVFLLPNFSQKKELLTATFIGAFSQLLITLITSCSALFFLKQTIYFERLFSSSIQIVMIVCLVIFVYSYFYPFFIIYIVNKVSFLSKNNLLVLAPLFSVNEKLIVLTMSFLRYVVFFFQYYLILEAFGVHFTTFFDLALIALCFLFTSVVPTFIFSEILVRGSVALFIFNFISTDDLAILSASVTLWLLNVAFPAAIGIFGLKNINLSPKKLW